MHRKHCCIATAMTVKRTRHNAKLYPTYTAYLVVELIRNLVAHGDAREGKWRGNWRMEWVASTLTPPPNVVYPALLKLMPTPRLPAVDWTDTPIDLNGLVRFRERRNLVSARVPSCSARATQIFCHIPWIRAGVSWEKIRILLSSWPVFNSQHYLPFCCFLGSLETGQALERAETTCKDSCRRCV